jgi:serine/threonine protein kinase
MTAGSGRSPLARGDRVAWYRIERLLGSGGFGLTYLATDTNLDRPVAVKEFFPPGLATRLPDNRLEAAGPASDQPFREGLARFLSEARTLVKFSHRSIVRVYSVFEANQTAYLVMEYEDGEDLKTHLAASGRLDEQYLKGIFLQIADGLEQVHQRGFIHRDIKPANIIVRRDGTAVLLDFGATRPAGEVGHTTFVSGGYSPLEQVQRDLPVGPWTDIYSLAATLYSMITGKAPASATRRLAALARNSEDPLQPAAALEGHQYSAAFLGAIDAALEFHAQDRPQTLPEWTALFSPEPVDDVVAQPTHASAARTRSTQPTRPLAWRQRRRRRRVLGGLAAALLGGGLVVALQQWQSHRQIASLWEQAEAGYENGEYVDVALPIYREILALKPAHNDALERIDEIQRLQEALIGRLLRQQRLDSAGSALRVYIDSGAEPSSIRKFSEALASARDAQQIDAEFETIGLLIQADEHAAAAARLNQLSARAPDDSRIASLVALASEGVSRQQRERVIANQRAREAELARQRTESELQRRIEAANRRQRARRAAYDDRIAKVEIALTNGEIVTARRELDIAETYQIDDVELQLLRVRLEREEAFQRDSFSDSDRRYAQQQFEQLERAIEQNNTSAISVLTGGTGSRRQLFTQLLRQYSRVEIDLKNFRVSENPKLARAELEIVSLTMPNGDTVYPSRSYQSTNLEIRRYVDRWTPILW